MTEFEQASQLKKIKALALTVFNSEVSAEDWLRTYNLVLRATPMFMLKTVKGGQRVKDILMRIEYGAYS